MQNQASVRVTWLKAGAVWFLLTTAEVIHGTIRTLLFAPVVGDFRARQISVFTGSLIIMAIVYLSIRWIGVRRNGSLIAVGTTWLVLTLAFELCLGHFVFGYSRERVGADFNVWRGGLLPVGLLILALSPLIADKLRR